MIKAVFFDWFDTLVHYEPPRQELYTRILQELGISVTLKKLMLGIQSADKYFLEENTRLAVAQRNPQEQAEVHIRYQNIVLTGAGIKAERELSLKLMKRMMQLFQGLKMVIFDDVLPTLKNLRERGLTTGLLTNASKNVLALQSELGLEPYLNFIITSKEVGADKPEPPIFLAALERAGVKASESVHVGDHYNVDVTGARGVGIQPILLDRYNLCPEVSDCPRIHSLTELVQYI